MVKACAPRPNDSRAFRRYVPPRVLTNADLEKMVETTDEWILQRTGIRERHIVDPGVATSDLAKEAAEGAMREAGIGPDQLGFIVVGTTTPDTIFPSTACNLQNKLGAHHAWGFDLGAACSGFTYALTTATQMVAIRRARVRARGGRRRDVEHHRLHGSRDVRALRRRRGRGRRGAGRARTSRTSSTSRTRSTDPAAPALMMPAGGSRLPASHETVEKRLHYVKQEGQTVFKFAVKKTEEIARRVLAQCGVDASDVDLFVSHQANRRIITAAAERLGFDASQGRHQPRDVRQHDRRDDSAGARGRAPAGTA